MKNLDGQSFITSNAVLLGYYACAVAALAIGFVGPLSSFAGLFGLVALIGAIVTRNNANKENAPMVAAHCTWITRSIWVNIALTMLIVSCMIVALGTGDTTALENLDVENMDDILSLPDNPAFQSFVITFAVTFALVGIVFIWFLYRMIRGVLAVVGGRAPSK